MSALRVFINRVLFILWLSISRGLGKAIRICEINCDTKIVETVQDYAEAMLGLWYGVVSYAGSQLYWETKAMDWEK